MGAGGDKLGAPSIESSAAQAKGAPLEPSD